MRGGGVRKALPAPVGEQVGPDLRLGPVRSGESLARVPWVCRTGGGFNFLDRGCGGKGFFIKGGGRVRIVHLIHRTSTRSGGQARRLALTALAITVPRASLLRRRVGLTGRLGDAAQTADLHGDLGDELGRCPGGEETGD